MIKEKKSPVARLKIDRATTTKLYRQIYERFRTAIEQGVLRPGDRVASARSLASELGVSRGTIETAYNQLVGEGYFSPQGQAGRAIAAMFGGLTLAMVLGVPMGSFLGNLMGWRLPFFAVAGLAALALLAMAAWLPSGLHQGAAGKVSTQLSALGNRAILTMMLVTTLGFGSTFAAFTFVTPILTDITGFSPAVASGLLVVFGAATFAGNHVGGYLSSHWGWPRALRLTLLALAVTQTALALSLRSPWLMVPMLFLWGLFSFGLSPGLQAGMLATAEKYTPQAVDFASGLNISAFNFGISFGSWMGALMVGRNLMHDTPWAGLAVSLLALLPLTWLARRNEAQLPASAAAVR